MRPGRTGRAQTKDAAGGQPIRRQAAPFSPAGGTTGPSGCFLPGFHLQNARNMLYYLGDRKGGGPMAGKSRYTFDSKIHVYRATRRMTQQELADLVGVSRQTIIQRERNRYNPSMLLAYSIAQVFGVTIEDLFDFREA